ncbi:hypothetical protein K435DRAFT_705816 [Dendrothele bispora CBS 962.96]|uniref:Tc1-like transposase DDE domain-containing protein n=1 Tax=Dendrothele bispora (strain CBS 962.96) TaxID=1314807 RepID=A0A4S8KKI3_DENBC|nr:hypothetical protein K435DRAFT_705816 [Dendrothele bispora CBS 962.96]
MNMRPGGKQAIMRDGWYYDCNKKKVVQRMVDEHGVAKGMKQVLVERGLWRQGLIMQCSDKLCAIESRKNCCCTRILDLQPDFQAQKSLVHETIEEAGHLCIFLPKFHWELIFIEFFWGAVKRYLREHCDYSFDGLKKNMPDALASVSISTIQKWEHHMVRWMDAYRSGLDVKEAQIKVRAFSSKRYKSHRRVPETLAHQFDV